MATNADLIAQLYIGFYDRAPDPVGLEWWVNDLNNGRPIEEIANDFAASPEASETYPYFQFPSLVLAEQFLGQVYENVFGRPIDADGLAYYSAKLDAGVSAGEVVLDILRNASTNAGSPDQAYLANKVAAGLHWATDAATSDINIYQDNGRLTGTADASAHGILDGITTDPATVTAANAASDAFFAGVGSGELFSLTPDVDHVVGTAGDDTIVAGTSNTGFLVQNNLGTQDTIDGGAGNDILKIIDSSIFGGTFLNPLSVTNVETVSIQSAAVTYVDFTNFSGVDDIVDNNSFGDVSVYNVQGPATLSMIRSSGDFYVNFADSADLGDTLNVNFNGANDFGSDVYMEVTSSDANIAGLKTINIDSSGNASNVELDVFGPTEDAAFETLNITGDADLSLSGLSDGFDKLTLVDAQTFTGALDLDLRDDDEDLTFLGGSGDTTLRVGGGNDTITTGAGDDDISIRWGTSGHNTISTGAGDDIVRFFNTFDAADKYDGGAGYDTIALQGDQAGLLNGNTNVTNVENLTLWGTLHNADLTLNGYNLPTGLDDLTINGNLTSNGNDLTITNLSRGTITLASSLTIGDVTLAGDGTGSQTFTLVVDGGITVDDAYVGGMKALDISFADASSGLTLNSLTFNQGDVQSVSISGSDGNSVLINATGGANTVTDLLDLSNFTGHIEFTGGAQLSPDIQTINIGDVSDYFGADSVITIAGGANNEFVFGSALADGVTITNFDVDTDIANPNDVLDLAGLGVTSFADLDLSTVGVIKSVDGSFGDITITNIVGGVWGDLSANNFHFA